MSEGARTDPAAHPGHFGVRVNPSIRVPRRRRVKAVPVCFGVSTQPSKPPRVNAPVDVPHVFQLVPTDVIP